MEKEKRKQIVVVSRDEVMYELVKYNKIKCKYYNSAFDLYENHAEDVHNSVILIKEGILKPKEIEYEEFAEGEEKSVLSDILNKYDIEENDEVENKMDLLNFRCKKVENEEKAEKKEEKED